MDTLQQPNAPTTFTGPREEQSYSQVLICGLATTALTLFGVYVLDKNTSDFHIMGWHANYVLPIGAFLVGLAAGSGYGVASWFSGIKITRGLLWAVLALQLCAYFSAQYIEFANLKAKHPRLKSVGFFRYFDFVARSFTWKDDKGKVGTPLGGWGYLFLGLEVLGFAGGGIVVPAVLSKAPYCQDCSRYMRTRQLTIVPASVPAKKVKKSDTAGQAAYQAEQEKAFEAGKKTWETLRDLATANQTGDFQKKLAELDPGKKQAAKLPARLSIQTVTCGRCHCGQLRARLLTGQGREIKQVEFGRVELRPEFVMALQSAAA